MGTISGNYVADRSTTYFLKLSIAASNPSHQATVSIAGESTSDSIQAVHIQIHRTAILPLRLAKWYLSHHQCTNGLQSHNLQVLHSLHLFWFNFKMFLPALLEPSYSHQMTLLTFHPTHYPTRSQGHFLFASESFLSAQ